MTRGKGEILLATALTVTFALAATTPLGSVTTPEILTGAPSEIAGQDATSALARENQGPGYAPDQTPASAWPTRLGLNVITQICPRPDAQPSVGTAGRQTGTSRCPPNCLFQYSTGREQAKHTPIMRNCRESFLTIAKFQHRFLAC